MQINGCQLRIDEENFNFFNNLRGYRTVATELGNCEYKYLSERHLAVSACITGGSKLQKADN